MEVFTEQAVQIILTVKEGRGFEFVGERNPIVIVCSLENQCLETTVTTSTNPNFGNELVWESDKKAIRRLRTAKVPLKLECFALVGLNPQKRVKIGFILLNLCSALIENPGKTNSTASAKWNNLICSSSHLKGKNPEILLCLKIETVNEIENEELLFTSDKSQQKMSANPQLPLMKNYKELIQVGPPMITIDQWNTDIFQLSIEVDTTNILKYLLNKILIDAPLLSRVCFTCKAFGNEFNSEACRSDANELSSTVEKVTFHVQSSLSFIQQYLQNSSLFTIKLMVEKLAIGVSEIDVSKLVPTTNISDFLAYHAVHNTVESKSDCVLNCFKSLCLPEQSTGDSSSGTVHFNAKVKLTYCQSIPFAEQEQRECLTENRNTFAAEKIMVAGGDREPSRESLSSYVQELLHANSLQKKTVSSPQIPTQKHLKTVFSQSEQTLQQPRLQRVYYTFTLDISLQSVVFHKFPPQNKIFFKFHHPKAEVITSNHPETVIPQLNKTICLENIQCKFRFVSTPEEISRLLLAHPPKISACAKLGDEIHQLAIATLDVARLLSEKKRCIYPATMIDLAEGDELGLVYISMNLENCSEQVEDRILRPLPSDLDIGPAVFDERVAYGIIAELEDWRNQQQAIFKSELALKEEIHLKSLMAEFQKRRDELKQKLDDNLHQSQTLRETLQRASQEYELKSIQQAEEGRELIRRKEELERSYNLKFQDLREASKRMEDDLNHEMELMESRISELMVTIDELKKENIELKKKQGKDVDDTERSTLTKDQTASLLVEMKLMGEKLDSAKQSKTFFKEQWARAVREIHRIKNEHQQAVQIQIRDYKEELKSFGFQKLLDKEEAELEDDRTVLDQVRTILHKGSESLEDYTDKFYAVSAPPKQMLFSNQEQVNNNKAKIRQLVDERDALLRTGNYSMSDDVVHQLNTEIRRLITNKSV